MQSAEPRVLITPATPPIDRQAAVPTRRRATMLAEAGQMICSGTLSIDLFEGSWAGVIDEIDRPGALATLFFSGGLREIALLLDDGRSATGRIVSARVTPDGQRSYRIEGSGEFGSRTENFRSFP